MSREPWNWTKEDLEYLIGQSESLRLEFKDSRLLDPNAKGNSFAKIADNLSVEASAFANTEGGTIVIGIAERKEGRARIAEKIDGGVSSADWWPERLQAVVESNLSPHLTGVRLRQIFLDETRTRCAFVISIPQGTTAYQASDKRYYGRSEYEAKALADHEIRLRMFRGKVGNAKIIVDNWNKHTLAFPNSKDFNPRLYSKEIGQAVAKLPKTEGGIIAAEDSEPQDYAGRLLVDRYIFQPHLVNIGEINIREFKATTRIFHDDITFGPEVSETVKDGWPSGYGPEPMRPPTQMRVNIYPSDIYDLDPMQIHILPSTDLTAYKIELHWTIYLSDTLPIKGTIDLSEAIQAITN